VSVSWRMHELPGLQIVDLGHHQDQEGVGGDVEGYVREHVGTALVQLAGEPSLGRIKLEQAVTGRQGRPLEISRVPCVHDHSSGGGIPPQRIEKLGNLIDAACSHTGAIAPVHSGLQNGARQL